MTAAGGQQRLAKILTYWHAVEMFDPHDIPPQTRRPQPGKKRVEVFKLRERALVPPLPWEQAHRRFGEPPEQGRFGSEWRHTVYGGVFTFRAVREAFEQVLGYTEDEDYAGSRRDEVSATFAFTVDSGGVLLDGTVAISSCAWATGRLHNRKPGTPGWLDGFDEEAESCAKAVTRLLSGPVAYPDIPGSPAAGWRGTVTGGRRGPRGFGRALTSYLSDPAPTSGRLDLRTPDGRRRVLAGLHPTRFPPARWPAATSKKLVAGQQFAVNEIAAELANGASRTGQRAGDSGGLFAVNGPPGTGKTTLLRDLIASVVVRRAEALATLPSPSAGFDGTLSRLGTDGKVRKVRTLRADLTGFEIVVASSNNAAAENITKELPALTAIGCEWRPDRSADQPTAEASSRSCPTEATRPAAYLADQPAAEPSSRSCPTGASRPASYFADQATALLGEPAWGLLAAALGNAEKRAQFKERFWFGDSGMRAKLQALQGATPPGDWPTAVRHFTEALGLARKLAAERGAVATAWQSPAPRRTERGCVSSRSPTPSVRSTAPLRSAAGRKRCLPTCSGMRPPSSWIGTRTRPTAPAVCSASAGR